ncbi:MAG: protein kinase [Deltaproteobacteria bacterium]|nr:protein kinase [Deltaproteobacteria bacterium]
MAARRVVFLEPTGRRAAELGAAAAQAGLDFLHVSEATHVALFDADAILVAAGVAEVLGPGPRPRWVVGDQAGAARLAGASVACGAVGVLLTPIDAETLAVAVAADVSTEVADLGRARHLIAASGISLDDEALLPFATAYGADDFIIWWRDGDQMTPHGARPLPNDQYRGTIATAARIAAAAGATTITGGPAGSTRSVIAAPLRSAPGEVSGLVAVVSDRARRFTVAERADLRAIATRLARELGLVAGHRRLVAEEERLRAGSFHDPLTGALTRGAFEQTVAIAKASATRRGEPLTLCLLDVVSLRRINLGHGHKAGDEILAQLASRVRAAVRGNDAVGRLGGDELAILLANADVPTSRDVATKLIEKVLAQPFQADGQLLTVELHGAVTAIGKGERSGEAAIARAIAATSSAAAGAIVLVSDDEQTHGVDAGAGATAAAVAAGTTLGGTYQVLHELSRGAMGVVYRAEDLGLGRPVAIKVLRSDLGSDKELVTRFRAEAAMLASLHHKNLVQVYTLGVHAGDVYFVMELVEGQPLGEVLRASSERGEWLPHGAVAQIALEIGDALDAMHAVGLIHRDVKPANILLDRERDRAVLVDVGVAMRAGDRREAAGTPGYSAPESFLDAQESAETDVYGLAATVYSMLVGVPPFGSGALTVVIARQLHEPLVPPSHRRPTLSPAIDAVLTKALDPQPKKRWASAGAFAIALGSALERLPQRPEPTSPPSFGHAATDLKSGGDQVAAVFDHTQSLVAPVSVVAVQGSTPGQVRAAHFRVAAKLIEHRLGGAALRAVADASPALTAALAPTLSPLGWEPADLLVELCQRCAPADDPAALARQIGRSTISATFARFFGANPASLPVDTVVRATPAFWGRYHDWALLSLTVAAPGVVELTSDRAPGSTLLCDVIVGSLERVAELAGAKELVVRHDQCACRGAPRCAFRLTWAT